MKKTIFPAIAALVFLSACEGPEGPAGPPGQDVLGQVFEADNVNYEFDSEFGFWSTALNFPSDIEVFESDAVLAYRFVDVVEDGDGGTADAWEMLPNVYFLDGDAAIQYVFNHTFFDVELIIDGNFDLSDLDPSFTDDQSFRFVVVPSEFLTSSGVELSDHEAVLDALDISLE